MEELFPERKVNLLRHKNILKDIFNLKVVVYLVQLQRKERNQREVQKRERVLVESKYLDK